ncbi:hypothetical protein NXS19_009800 [Fusarium pseudograminearum]|nr:hypothetical protein NXS19_009800 [Fusarium pseudograminearum]
MTDCTHLVIELAMRGALGDMVVIALTWRARILAKHLDRYLSEALKVVGLLPSLSSLAKERRGQDGQLVVQRRS